MQIFRCVKLVLQKWKCGLFLRVIYARKGDLMRYSHLKVKCKKERENHQEKNVDTNSWRLNALFLDTSVQIRMEQHTAYYT